MITETLAPNGLPLHLIVSHVGCAAKGAMEIQLRRRDGEALPAFEPGAHLEIRLPNGLVRHYSLCNAPTERNFYRLGVGLAPQSRGGSRFVHESLRIGDYVYASLPRNYFPLTANAQEYFFIAGGIGVTPILSMVHQCVDQGLRFRVLYCAQNRQRAAFLDEILELAGPAALFHFDDENGGRKLDPELALRDVSAGAHIYCCGPAPLMEAVAEAARARPDDHVHFEWFSPKSTVSRSDREFQIVIRSTGQAIAVPAGVSALDALERNGILAPSSCREGVCATCRTGVLSGIPDHRDSVLSDEDRARNKSMMICVSRALSDVIELDL